MRIFKNKMVFKWAKSEGLTDAAFKKAAAEIESGLIDGDLGGVWLKNA